MITVNDRSVPWQPEMTLAALLESLDNGQHVAVVRLNGKLVSRPNFDTTVIPGEAMIDILPMIAGG